LAWNDTVPATTNSVTSTGAGKCHVKSGKYLTPNLLEVALGFSGAGFLDG
jgi:hypothetical protein